MTLCPIALTAGCEKCALLKVCPLKTVIGNYQPDAGKPSPKNGKQPKAN